MSSTSDRDRSAISTYKYKWPTATDANTSVVIYVDVAYLKLTFGLSVPSRLRLPEFTTNVNDVIKHSVVRKITQSNAFGLINLLLTFHDST